MSFRVNVEELAAAAGVVSGLGEELAAACAAADSSVERSLAGWRGLSAVALAERVSDWASVTAALVGRLAEFAAALRVSAYSLSAWDEQGADALS